MPKILTDDEIKRLLNEPKRIAPNWETRLKPVYRDDSFQGRRSWDIAGDDGSNFRIDVRHNRRIPLDFSVILTFIDENKTEYILTRFNGRTPSEHTNKIEAKLKEPGSKFRNVFHIHTATERYQVGGFKIESFAEPTTRYSSLESAIYTFVHSNGCYGDEPEPDPQRSFLDDQ